MPLLELGVASGDALSVRRFTIEERMSALFSVGIWARSPNEDIDLEAVVGREASFRVASGLKFAQAGERRFTGLCATMELLHVEPSGLSTYHLVLVPRLWLLGERRNHRLFQHLSVPDIVKKLCDEWQVAHRFQLDQAPPVLELRTQYGESDLAFLSRLCEEAGIAFRFAEDDEAGSVVVFDDAPQGRDPRAGALGYVDQPNESAEMEFATAVRLGQQVRSGRFGLRDHDFRRSPKYELLGATPRTESVEGSLEQYQFAPGSSVVERSGEGGGATLVGDDQGVARHDDKTALARATRRLEAAQVRRRVVSFQTNALDLTPGVVLTLAKHPRSDLADARLLVTEVLLEGSPDGAWSQAVQAAFATLPFRPRGAPARPDVQGLQSAVVVGPRGEEIYTDELGRVRVQFHWDREGRYDDRSSCFMRVNQGWAGSGFGMVTIPRVGQEVLVAFLEGNPDQPVVVGRLYNATAVPPYPLPEQKTRSGWRTDSSPGSGGFNELMFEDLKGQELVYVQAERNLEKLVKLDESESTGRDRTVSVQQNRTSSVGGVDALTVGGKYGVTMVARQGGPATSVEMVDQRICLTTGQASIVLEGPNVTIAALGTIKVKSSGGDVELEGGPWVKINCGTEAAPEAQTFTMHHISGVLRDQDGAPIAGQTVVVTGSDGVAQAVTTDANGSYVALVAPGPAEVKLPEGLHYGTGPGAAEASTGPAAVEGQGPVV
ncbi:MAG: type VI secretion system tip protein VgrG [Myxococcales bacterium]|nr:type VI secretion system tip protein VgrG [Myxococcales bacterium]